jgi:hypothetical protein
MEWTAYVLNMTSQTWRDPAGVSSPVIWHTMVVVVPKNYEGNGFMTMELSFGAHTKSGVITRLDNRYVSSDYSYLPHKGIDSDTFEDEQQFFERAAQKTAYFATRTKGLGGALFQLPNGFEIFGDDPSQFPRVGDELKGWSYGNFLDHTDEPLRLYELVQAKSVVRALDTMTAFTSTLETGPVTRFGLIGYSKLATATWIAGGVDDRVKAIAPMSNGVRLTMPLNITQLDLDSREGRMSEAKARHTSQETAPSNGGDSYIYTVFHGSLLTDEYKRFSNIIDPAAWIEKIEKPMFWAEGANDEVINSTAYADQTRAYLPQLSGQTRHLMMPNCNHDQTMVCALPAASAFFRGFILDQPPPAIEYQSSSKLGSLVLTVKQKSKHVPNVVRQWKQTDFYHGFGKTTWQDTILEETTPGSGTWVSDNAVHQVGDAVFIALEYSWPDPGSTFTISSPLFHHPSLDSEGLDTLLPAKPFLDDNGEIM